MSVETLEQVDTQVEPYVFSGNDRCDADPGVKGYRGVVVAEQAYHRWTKDGKELLLCNHHNSQQQEALFVSGWNPEHHPHAATLGEPLDINNIE